MPSEGYLYKVGGVAAIVGVAVLMIGTLLHPMDADPADAPAAFAEYAADQLWVASHLTQLLGVVLITLGLVALAWRLRRGRAGAWAMLGAAAAVAALALTGVLQAVDGIALKIMVDRWADASPDAQMLLFEGAFVVRQVEIGLASMGILFLGLTAALYAGAFWLSEDAPNWLGWLALLGAAGMIVSGVAFSYAGFSENAMMIGMPSWIVMLSWVVLVGVFLLRSRESSEAIG